MSLWVVSLMFAGPFSSPLGISGSPVFCSATWSGPQYLVGSRA